MDDMALQDLQLDNPFWAFSGSAWSSQTLREQLLHAQDSGHVVNLLLFAVWCSREGLRPSNWQAQHWHDWRLWQQWHAQHTCPVRAQRMQLPREGVTRPLYQSLLEAELASEQIEQALLYRYASHFEPIEASAKSLLEENIATLLAQTALNASTLSKQVMAELVALLEGCQQ
ncbi:MAG: DUF2390 domain-containing protein [Oleiphilaceae bacterium]|nr:DUF2390 domain-containing protein [Oleiphilaceae bacterium]